MSLALFAHIANGDQAQGMGPDMQAGDAQVHGDPHAVLLGSQQEAFLRMKDARLVGGQAKAIHSSLDLGAEQVGRLHAQEFGAGKPAQPFGHGIGIDNGIVFRVDQEKSIARFLEQRHRQFGRIVSIHE